MTVIRSAGKFLAEGFSLNVFVYGFLGLFVLAGLLSRLDRRADRLAAVAATVTL